MGERRPKALFQKPPLKRYSLLILRTYLYKWRYIHITTHTPIDFESLRSQNLPLLNLAFIPDNKMLAPISVWRCIIETNRRGTIHSRAAEPLRVVVNLKCVKNSAILKPKFQRFDGWLVCSNVCDVPQTTLRYFRFNTDYFWHRYFTVDTFLVSTPSLEYHIGNGSQIHLLDGKKHLLFGKLTVLLEQLQQHRQNRASGGNKTCSFRR